MKKRSARALAAVGLAAIALAAASRVGATIGPVADTSGQARPTTTRFDVRVVRTYPHDSKAFTQGLLFRDGFLYESTGLNGRSSLRKVKLETGEIVQRVDLEQKHFAEGLTDFGGRLYQLTYQSRLGFVYDLRTFTQERSFPYEGEGWGLTHDATRLIMSDGSAALRFLDPATLRESGRVTVMDGPQPVRDLNELEYIKGEIFANIWHTDEIVIIQPGAGRVTGRVNLRGLLPPSDRTGVVDVLNGIAYDAAGDRLFVTGKLWPKVFEIRLVPGR
jgi:glutaminyl-peptide cyclotransferase